MLSSHGSLPQIFPGMQHSLKPGGIPYHPYPIYMSKIISLWGWGMDNMLEGNVASLFDGLLDNYVMTQGLWNETLSYLITNIGTPKKFLGICSVYNTIVKCNSFMCPCKMTKHTCWLTANILTRASRTSSPCYIIWSIPVALLFSSMTILGLCSCSIFFF